MSFQTQSFDLVDILLTVLFTAGLVVLGLAIYFEAITEAPFYVILASISAGLSISATFIAALRKR